MLPLIAPFVAAAVNHVRENSEKVRHWVKIMFAICEVPGDQRGIFSPPVLTLHALPENPRINSPLVSCCNRRNRLSGG